MFGTMLALSARRMLFSGGVILGLLVIAQMFFGYSVPYLQSVPEWARTAISKVKDLPTSPTTAPPAAAVVPMLEIEGVPNEEAPAVAATPVNDPIGWKVLDCKINKIQGKCAVFVSLDDHMTIVLAKQAQRVVFVMPVLDAKDGETGAPPDLTFNASTPGVWFDDQDVQMVPRYAMEFSANMKSVLLKDYNYFVRRAAQAKIVVLGFRLRVNDELQRDLYTSEFKLPPIPAEFMPDEGKGYGNSGFGRSQLVGETPVLKTRATPRFNTTPTPTPPPDKFGGWNSGGSTYFLYGDERR